MTELTIIPDIHADLARLNANLAQVKDNKIAFLGDFIDAGQSVKAPDDLAVLEKVKELVETDRAMAVMGNHELNAILFHRKNKQGAPLRSHSPNNYNQHRSFIDKFGLASPLAIHWTEWFLSLPLWIEHNGLRLVHACWDQNSIEVIKKRRADGRLHPSDLEEIAAKQTPFAQAVETLTSGVEATLPENYKFHDGKGVIRENVRVAWWLANKGTWREVALSVPDKEELPDTLVPSLPNIATYPSNQAPVLFGHYKMEGTPTVASAQALCLDYPNKYCVYHWSGETALVSSNLWFRSI